MPGKPQGKGRPRFTNTGRAYTPPKTKAYETLVKQCAIIAGAKPLKGPVGLHVEAWFAHPKSKHRKRKPLGEAWQHGRPDADNILKAVADAVNGLCFDDDAQVCKAFVQKRYVAQGEEPFVLVKIWRIR